MPKNHRNYQKTRHIALSGLLFALAMALSFIEGTLVIPGLLPGMKLGLANIVVMYALFFMGPRQALVLDILKALFVFLVSGFTAGFLSLCGGLLSLAVMWVLYYLLPVRPTWFILSVCGALAHNVGQLLGAGVIISSSLSLYYAPVMLVLGLVMGAAVGNFHDIVIFYCRADLPQALDELPAVLRLNVMETLIANEVFHLIQPVQRGAHLHQLVQNGEHLLLDHGAALQQDLAHCQNFATGEEA